MSDESPTEVEVVLANDVVTFLDEHVDHVPNVGVRTVSIET